LFGHLLVFDALFGTIFSNRFYSAILRIFLVTMGHSNVTAEW